MLTIHRVFGESLDVPSPRSLNRASLQG